MKVGSFYKEENGILYGKIQALGLGNVDAAFEERTSKKGELFFKIIADPAGSPFEIGSAWPKEKDGLRYFSVSLDTVFTTKPINAALFPDQNNSNTFNLVWSKPSGIEAKPEAKTEIRAADRQSVKRRGSGMNAAL